MARRPLVVALSALAVPAIAAVALVRQPGVPATNTIWAEDGPVFLQQALSHSFASSLVTPNAGYLELWPRLLVQIVRPFAVGSAAAVLAVSGALSLGALSIVVYHASSAQIRSPLLRSLLVASMVLLPIATSELLDNVVNVPWWLFFATFWVLLWRPTTGVGKVVAALVALLAVASNPLTFLFLPLVVLRLVALPRWSEQWVVAGFVLGSGYQVYGIARAAPTKPVVHSLHGIVQLFGVRVGFGWIAGSRLTSTAVTSFRDVAVGLGLTLFVVVLVVGLTRPDPLVRVFTAVSGLLSILTFTFPLWERGLALPYAGEPAASGARYACVPLLLVIGIVLVSADRWSPRVEAGRAGVLPALLCLLLLVPTWVADFHDENLRSGGPRWNREVAAAVRRCNAGRVEHAVTPISPPGWEVALPCSTLTDH